MFMYSMIKRKMYIKMFFLIVVRRSLKRSLKKIGTTFKLQKDSSKKVLNHEDVSSDTWRNKD